MEELKALFGDGALTYGELESKLKESNIELANLKKGEYVSKGKLDRINSEYKDLQARYTELQKGTENYENLKTELETLKSEKLTNEQLKIIRDARVDEKFSKFVLNEVKSQLKENEKFEDVLNAYVKENQHFLTTRQNVFKQGASMQDLEHGNGVDDKNTNQIMNSILRNRGEN